MEAHFVRRNAAGALAVVGVMMRAGASDSERKPSSPARALYVTASCTPHWSPGRAARSGQARTNRTLRQGKR